MPGKLRNMFRKKPADAVAEMFKGARFGSEVSYSHPDHPGEVYTVRFDEMLRHAEISQPGRNEADRKRLAKLDGDGRIKMAPGYMPTIAEVKAIALVAQHADAIMARLRRAR